MERAKSVGRQNLRCKGKDHRQSSGSSRDSAKQHQHLLLAHVPMDSTFTSPHWSTWHSLVCCCHRCCGSWTTRRATWADDGILRLHVVFNSFLPAPHCLMRPFLFQIDKQLPVFWILHVIYEKFGLPVVHHGHGPPKS